VTCTAHPLNLNTAETQLLNPTIMPGLSFDPCIPIPDYYSNLGLEQFAHRGQIEYSFFEWRERAKKLGLIPQEPGKGKDKGKGKQVQQPADEDPTVQHSAEVTQEVDQLSTCYPSIPA
jgi:hypothetical protein